MSEASSPPGWPPRWVDLDPRTIEFIARLNEAERDKLIELSHLSDQNLERLKAMLSLAPETWDAGIRLASRSASWTRVTKRFPGLVLALAGLLVALNTIWGFVGPAVKAMMQGARP